MKKNWTNPEIETLNLSETAQGKNAMANDGSLYGDLQVPVGPCPTTPTTTNPDDPS